MNPDAPNEESPRCVMCGSPTGGEAAVPPARAPEGSMAESGWLSGSCCLVPICGSCALVWARTYAQPQARVALWALRDALREADSSLLLRTDEDAPALTVAGLWGAARVVVAPGPSGELAYWTWWQEAGVPSMRPLEVLTDAPADAARQLWSDLTLGGCP